MRMFIIGCLLAGAVFAAPESSVRDQATEPRGRKAVIDIQATGTWAVEGVTSVIEAKASSPAGCDISGLHWCICNASGNVVSEWKGSVSGHKKVAHLKMYLQTGEYSLKATDGTWFYGNVPVRVLPRENRYARAAVEIHEPQDPVAENGAKRFWRDMWRGEFSQAEAPKKTPRRVVARFCAVYPERIDDLVELIDRTAASMKGAGENALVCPAKWDGAPDFLSAWYAKFNVEGLKVFPMLELGADGLASRSSKHELQRRINDLVHVGMRHESFGGICLKVARRDAFDAKELNDLGRGLSDRRTLWVIDDADLADFTHPLRGGDAVSLAARGDFSDASQPDARIPFIQAFRTLPAVAFADVAGFDGAVRVRHAEYNGMSWFYVFNPGTAPVHLKIEMPERTRDLARDERVGGLFGASECELALKPGEFRAYSAPEGLTPRSLNRDTEVKK